MKCLHLFSNWKWTGPAEPAVNLARALADRGHEVRLLSGRPPRGRRNWLAEAAAERGMEVGPELRLKKHRSLFANRADRRDLARLLSSAPVDLVHCHLPNDHLVAAKAAPRDVPIVRSLYDGRTPKNARRHRATFGRRTDFLIAASDRVRRETAKRFGIPEDRTRHVEGAVDLARFDPERDLPDLRDEYGIEEGDFVLGIVARVQPRRRFDVFFDAIDRLAADVPNLRVLVVGRGTHIEAVAKERARHALVADRIVFPGYRRADEYVATLALLHAKVFLWPGSDGSCRAVREAMAMGVPVVAARVGMLPEIVTDGETGLLVDHDPDSLAHAVRRLALGLGEREELGAGARRTAVEKFDLRRQAESVEAVYRQLAEV